VKKLLSLFALFVASCGGSGKVYTISGKVESSNIKGLKVCIAQTENCTVTDESGTFTLKSSIQTPTLEFFIKDVKLGDYKLQQNGETITPDKITGDVKSGEVLARLIHSLNGDATMSLSTVDLSQVTIKTQVSGSIEDLIREGNFSLEFSYSGKDYTVNYSNASLELCQDDNCSRVDYQRNWLVLIYMDGDNNLNPFADTDIQELSKVTYPPNVKVVVLRDFSSEEGYAVYASDEVTGEIKEIERKTEELDMGSPETLKEFIRTYVTNYPATYKALILWDHGDGWKSRMASYDESNNNYLYMYELVDTLKELKEEGISFNLIGFDECLMGGLEVFVDVKDFADVFVASEKTEAGEGWDYSLVMGKLVKNPEADPYTFGKMIVDAYKEAYAKRNNLTLVAVKKEEVKTLLSAINDLANALTNDPTPLEGIEVRRLEEDAMPDYVDLHSLATGLLNNGLNLGALTTIKDTIEDLHSALINTDLKGIYIYFPRDNFFECYGYETPSTCSPYGDRTVDRYYNPFATVSTWDDFLESYFSGE